VPQNDNDPTGPKWQDRQKPYKLDLGGVIAWMQRVPTESYTKDGHSYRGGAWWIQFKNNDPNCKGGKWRQIVRRHFYAGTGPDDLQEVAGYDNAWKIDTTKAETAKGKNADYPHQKDGEMLDSPESATESITGTLANGKLATYLKKTIEFYAIYFDANGKICKMLKWSFSTTFIAKAGEDLTTKQGMDNATVTSDYSDPSIVSADSAEGKQATSDYEQALKHFTK
jgi:hypothetical protein